MAVNYPCRVSDLHLKNNRFSCELFEYVEYYFAHQLLICQSENINKMLEIHFNPSIEIKMLLTINR